MPDPRKKLYQALTSNNFDLGSYDEFNSKMDNPESRKKLYDAANENDFDLGTFDDFEFKIGSSKKKKNSGSTSPGQKLDSAQENGSSDGPASTKNSSGFPAIEKPFEEYIPKPSKAGKNKIREEQLRKELANTKVTPENMDTISSKTDELSALQKESQKQKQAEKNYRVSQLENSFYEATRNNDDDAVAEKRLKDAVQVKGIWNNFTDAAKKTYNSAVESFVTSNPGTAGLLSLKTSTDPLADEKKQVETEASNNKEKLTPEEINQRAGELFKAKQKENLFIDRANSFLDNLDSKDKQLLLQDRALKAEHLEEDNLKRLKVTSAMRTVVENKISEYKDIESQLTKLKDDNKPFPEDLYARYQSLGGEIKNIASELQKNEDYILKNKKDLGTAKEEFDLFKREYGDLKNFIGNVGASASELGSGLLGAYNYINTLSPNAADNARALGGQEAVSNLDKSIAENRENLRKPVDQIESAEGLVNYASDLVANQLPILAATSTGAGGLAALGVSSTGKKFTEMNEEVLSGKENYSPLQMASAPLLYGGAEVISEIPTLSILKKGGRVLESVAKNEASLLTKTAKEKAKDWVKDWGLDMSKEMAGEQFTNFAQNFNDKFVLGKDNVNLLDNTGQVFKDTFTLTSILKSAPHVFGAVVRPFQSKNDIGKLDENSQKIIEFSRQLESGNLTQTEKEVIKKQIDKATSESSKITANTIGKIDNMPAELYDEVIRLNGQAGEIKAQAKEISDGNLSNKKQLLESLNEDYKNIQEQRNSIIEGKTSVVDVLPLKEQEKLKKQALEELTEELNPDGSKNLTIDNDQITKRANEINNRTNNLESLQYESSEVKRPNGTEGFEVKVKSSDGRGLGDILIMNNDGEYEVTSSDLYDDTSKGKGVGFSLYSKMVEEANNRGIEIYSDSGSLSTDAEKVWRRLESEGLAEKVRDITTHYTKKTFPQFKTILKDETKSLKKDSKNEVNSPLDSQKTQQNGSEAEVNLPQNQKTNKQPAVEENRVVEYTNGKGEKATLNTNDIEISEDKNNKLLFTENGNRIGHIEISKPENGQASIKLSGIFNPSLEKKGIGTIMYKQAANLLKSKYNLDLVSDKQRTPESEALWAKLEREGNAVVIGDKNTGNTSDYQYKFVQNESPAANDASANGDVRSDINTTSSSRENTRVQKPINTPTRKGEVAKKLNKINSDLFGLDTKKSKASTAIMEKTIETMAERSGISKEEMFDKLSFEKGDSETVAQLSKKGNALFQIIGKNAKLSNETKQFLKDAQYLEKQGLNPKEIYLKTGWEKGNDGKWKYDMHEGKADFIKQENGKLSEVFDYPQLYEKYPETKDINVVFNPKMDGDGMFDDKRNRLFVNPTSGDAESRLTVLHEIQHWIQKKEGFAKGGTVENARNVLDQKINGENNGSIKKVLGKFKSLISSKNSNPDEIKNRLSQLEKISSKSDFDIYQSIAGEVEARNVENRLKMSPEERKNTSISETEDVAKDEQIVLFQGEKGAMLAEDGKFIIYALEDPNVSTPLHELAHVYEHYLTDAERKTILDDANHKEWNRETSEHFARGFEKYLADGKAPNPEMKKLFEDFKKWLTDIYNDITNSEIDIKISPEMQKIYDMMLGNPDIKKVNFKDSEFTVEKKNNGETKIFKKNGKDVKEYTWRKTKDGKKRVKNANYYKILAIADGNMTENEINEANKKQLQESIDNFIPSNEYEVALLEIAKGTKFSKESLEKELGNKDSNWASDQFSKNKMASIENVAEGIVAENEDLNLDEQEVRNSLIDILGSNENIDSVRQQLNENYQKSIDPYFGLTEQEAINAYEEFMTDSERALFESVQAEESLSEKEKLQYYINQYEKSIESIPAEDRARIYEQFESERPERLPNSTESNENGDSKESIGEPKTEKVKSKADQILDWLDEMDKNLDQFGKENLSSGIPIVVAKASIQAMRTAVKTGQNIADVIQAGLDTMKNSDWYKSLNQTDKSKAEKYFNDTFANPQIDKNNLRQTENLMNRSASENISEDEAFDEVSKTFEKEREELRNEKPAKEYLRDAYRNFVKRFTDRQYLSKSLLSKSGLRNTRNLMINAHGASGKAKLLFEEAYNKIYKGLNRADRNVLDEIIQAKRFISIDENREQRGLEPVTHPNFIDKNKSEKFLSKLEKNLGEEKYKDLEKRAKEYFKTYKDLLQQVYDNGLISKESFDSMNNVDYQPRVFLEFVTDFNGDLAQNKRTNNLETGGLSSDQIKSMKEGDANSLVLNSEWLLTNSLLARQKAIAMNNINKRFMTEEYPKALKRYETIDPKNFKNKEEERFYKYFKELSSKVIDNPYTGETSGGNPKFKYDKTPANFQKAYYYVDGKQHQFFLEQELYESWVDKVGNFLDSKLKEALSYASGSALVKGIATGNNPAFPIVNTPRDFMFTTTFSDQYSNLVPKAMVQVGKDAFKSFKELRKADDSDVLKKYIEYGGAMDFLSSEGRLKKNSLVGKAIEKAVDPKFKDAAKSIFSKVTLSKISEYSEMMFRLGIFQRSIQNQLKNLGLKDISEVTDKQQIDDIYNEAVTNARSILDFNQGGSVTKDLEVVIPYVNVAFQGGRVAATAFEKDPIGTTSRVLQMATLGSSIPIGISLALLTMFKPKDDEDKSAGEIYLKAMEGISTYQKSKYMNIPIPIKNTDGEYMVIKIAKAQELSPVMSVTDDIYNNMIRSLTGQQKKTAGRILDDAAFTFNSNVMPIDFTSPAGFFTRTPIVKGTLTYTTGYDFFRDEPLSNDIGKVPLAVEGLNNPNVEDFYKKIGDNHKISPIRSKAFVESLITGPNTNPFVGMLYGGMDAAVSDKGMKEIGKDLFNSVYKSTGKRIISYPSDFNRKLAARKDLQEKIDQINIEKYKQKTEFNQLAKDYINKKVSKEDVNAKLRELDPADRKRMLNKIKDKVRLQGIDGAILDIKYEQGNDVKALMIMHYYGDITDGSKDSKEVIRQMKRAKGVLTPGVIYEYKKLKKELDGK